MAHLGVLQHHREKNITDKLTTCSKVIAEKLTVPQLIEKYPAYYGTKRFVTASTKIRRLSLS